METREALRVRSVSTRRGRSGSATRASIQTKSASSAAPEARSATVSGLLQLEVSAWERPKTIANRPAETVAVPARSSRGVFAGAASLRSSASAPTTVSAAKSTLTYMTKRQSRSCVSTPPSSRPIEAPLPPIAP